MIRALGHSWTTFWTTSIRDSTDSTGLHRKNEAAAQPFWLPKMTEKTLTSLEGLVIDKTVLCGRSTAGWNVKGTLRKVIPGMCFQVDQGPGSQISYLWRDLTVVDEPPSPKVSDLIEIVVDSMTLSIPGPPQLRRSDSGADYRYDGYPDCAFWTALGIPTFFVVPHCQYTDACIPATPMAMMALLTEVRPKAEECGGLSLELWAQQMATVTKMFPSTRQ